MSDLEEYFNSIKDEYSEAIKRINPCYIEMIEATLSYFPHNWTPNSILELGCGTGNLTILLRAKFPKANILGIDISRDSLEVCKKRLKGNNVELRKMDLQTVMFDNESFDIVISSLTIHHLTDTKRKALYKKAFKWINKNGWFVVCDRYCDENVDISNINREIWREKAFDKGTKEEEWNKWMLHETEQDHPGNLINQVMGLKEELNYSTIDIVWRKYLWAVIYARK